MKTEDAGNFVVGGVAALVLMGWTINDAQKTHLFWELGPIGYAIIGLGGLAILIGMIKFGFGEDEVKKKKKKEEDFWQTEAGECIITLAGIAMLFAIYHRLTQPAKPFLFGD